MLSFSVSMFFLGKPQYVCKTCEYMYSYEVNIKPNLHGEIE